MNGRKLRDRWPRDCVADPEPPIYRQRVTRARDFRDWRRDQVRWQWWRIGLPMTLAGYAEGFGIVIWQWGRIGLPDQIAHVHSRLRLHEKKAAP